MSQAPIGDWTWTQTTCWKKWEPFWKICEPCARQNGENLKLTWFCKGFFYMTPAWGCGAVMFLQYLWASNQSAGWFLDGFLLTGGFGLPLFSVWEQMLWRWSTRFALPLVLCTWHEDCMVYDLIADPLPEAAKPFGVSKYLDKCMSVLAMSECTNIIKHSHRCHSPSQVRSQSICKTDVPKQYFCTLVAATLLKSTWICNTHPWRQDISRGSPLCQEVQCTAWQLLHGGSLKMGVLYLKLAQIHPMNKDI